MLSTILYRQKSIFSLASENNMHVPSKNYLHIMGTWTKQSKKNTDFLKN